MNRDFNVSSAEQADNDFALARTVWERLRHEDPVQSLGLIQTLLGPALKSLGTTEKLSQVLNALDPATSNVAGPNPVFDTIRERFGREAPSLRERVFPKPRHYEVTGSESNRDLARILNMLVEPARDPIDGMKRPATGDKVLHLPPNPAIESEKRDEAQREREALSFKQRAGALFVREIQELLFDGRSFTSHSLQGALHMMHDHLKDSVDVEKAASDVINDFGQIGRIMESGNTFTQAVEVRQRMRTPKPNADEPAPPPPA